MPASLQLDLFTANIAAYSICYKLLYLIDTYHQETLNKHH